VECITPESKRLGHFDANTMIRSLNRTKSTRSVAIELHENANAIEAWRATLRERQRRRLVHPLSNVRRWRAATASPEDVDPHRDALKHWERFTACLRRMPPGDAISLWSSLSAEIEATQTPSYHALWRT